MTKIFPKYTDYANIFFSNLVIERCKDKTVSKYTIKLVKIKQLFYRPIYALSLVKLETLKICIKTHLKIRFIQTFKSPTRVLILLEIKPNSNFYLYMNY